MKDLSIEGLSTLVSLAIGGLAGLIAELIDGLGFRPAGRLTFLCLRKEK